MGRGLLSIILPVSKEFIDTMRPTFASAKSKTMSIRDNLDHIKTALPEGTTLVAVTKTKPVETIREAYEAGHRDFGENRIQEMAEKEGKLPGDIRWHMIGHVQTNKIKYMAPFVYMVHGCDRPKVLHELNKEAVKSGRNINCLLQVHIAKEESKFGFDEQELLDFVESGDWKKWTNIDICGLMGMATFTENMEQVRGEFAGLAQLFRQIQQKNLFATFDTLSMGMSGDYPIALEKGATHVRIGSAIFGER